MADHELVQQLAQRVRVLEDLEAIRTLKARYAQACDEKYVDGAIRPQEELDAVARRIAALFTEDCVWDGGERFGMGRGREAVYHRFRQATFSFAVHYFVLPDIVVDGDRARGCWYLWQPVTLPDGRSARLAGYEDDEYARVGGSWLISRLAVRLQFLPAGGGR